MEHDSPWTFSPQLGMLIGMESRILEVLGQRVRERRQQLGLTQEELAAVAEIDRSYVGGVERGERNLTFTMLAKLCVALKCDMGALTHGLPRSRA